MSFGYSVSDALLLAQLAWNALQNSRKTCGEHDNLTREVSALHVVLRRLELEIKKPDSPINTSTASDGYKQELYQIVSDCEKVLRVLDKVLEKYNALGESGRSGRKLWQRIKFGNGEMADLGDQRSKIILYTSSITFYLNMVTMGTIGRIEQEMTSSGGILREIQLAVHDITTHFISRNNHEGPVLTTYPDDDKMVWREFRRELRHDGFSSSVLHKHKGLILYYHKELGNRGLLDDPDAHTLDDRNLDTEHNLLAGMHVGPTGAPNSNVLEYDACAITHDGSQNRQHNQLQTRSPSSARAEGQLDIDTPEKSNEPGKEVVVLDIVNSDEDAKAFYDLVPPNSPVHLNTPTLRTEDIDAKGKSLQKQDQKQTADNGENGEELSDQVVEFREDLVQDNDQHLHPRNATISRQEYTISARTESASSANHDGSETSEIMETEYLVDAQSEAGLENAEGIQYDSEHSPRKENLCQTADGKNEVVNTEIIDEGAERDFEAENPTHDQPVKHLQVQEDAISGREIDMESNETSSSELFWEVIGDSICVKYNDPFRDLDDLITMLDELITGKYFRFQLADVQFLAVKLQDLHRNKEAEERFRMRRFIEDIPNSDLEILDALAKAKRMSPQSRRWKGLLRRVWKNSMDCKFSIARQTGRGRLGEKSKSRSQRGLQLTLRVKRVNNPPFNRTRRAGIAAIFLPTLRPLFHMTARTRNYFQTAGLDALTSKHGLR